MKIRYRSFKSPILSHYKLKPKQYTSDITNVVTYFFLQSLNEDLIFCLSLTT